MVAMPVHIRIMALGAAATAMAAAGSSGAVGVSPSVSTTASYVYNVGSCDIACDVINNGAVSASAGRTVPVAGNTFSLSAPTFAGSSSAVASSQDNPLLISATATATPDGTPGDRDSAYAETVLSFYITPVGGAPGTDVSVEITAALNSIGQTDSTPGAQLGIIGLGTGYANLTITDNFSELPPHYFSWSDCPFQGCVGPVNDNLDQTVNLIDGALYRVTETVFATAAVFGQGSSLTGTATADPTFIVQPGYSVAVSAGLSSLTPTPAAFPATFYTPAPLGPPPALPEPGTWVLALIGTGMAGAALRRRRAAAAATAET